MLGKSRIVKKVINLEKKVEAIKKPDTQAAAKKYKNDSERISFSYPKELRQEIIALAKEDNRSLSSMIQILLKEGLESRR
jgi:hypothetical protein